MVPVQVVADLNQGTDPKAAILALEAAVKAGALIGEIDWGITKDMANKRYAVDIKVVRVRNLADSFVVSNNYVVQRGSGFFVGRRSSPIAGRLNMTNASQIGVAVLIIDGVRVGLLPREVLLPDGNHTIEIDWNVDNALPFKQEVEITSGKTTNVAATTMLLEIGEKGPAGGFIYYDKGSYSDGWRYLEAAPRDIGIGVQWPYWEVSHKGDPIKIVTGTAIGTGLSNTNAIIKAHGVDAWAASLCRGFDAAGYSDWFLPSKDELALMFENLKEAKLGRFKNSPYWTSSFTLEYISGITWYFAWHQNFSYGHQSTYNDLDKNERYSVRACRRI